MPNWKKVAVSGSAASFSSLSVDTSITASIVSSSQFTGSLFGTASYASYASNGGVTQLLAGANITLAPTNGLGQVTISSTSGAGGFNTATGSYGSFYDTTTQTNPVANIPRSMSFNTTDITNGVSISGSTNPYNTYVKTENAGVYNIQFSAQLDKTDSGADEIVIWLAKNGTNLTDSATTITLSGNNDKQVAAWNWFVNSAANDYYQIIWYSADTDLRILAETAGGGHPGIPSVILTANRIDQFLSNTGSFSGSFIGNFTGSLFGTASQAVSSSYALSASYAPGGGGASFPYTGSAIISGSLTVTGSLNVSQGITGSVFGTASYAVYALSASYAPGGGGGGAAFPFTGSAGITGSLTVVGTTTTTTLVETSALRYKENVQDLESASSIFKLRPVTFDWKTTLKSDIGFIAEEVNEIIPVLAELNENGEAEGVKYSKLTVLLTKALQVHEQRLEAQQQEIEQLKQEIFNIKNK